MSEPTSTEKTIELEESEIELIERVPSGIRILPASQEKICEDAGILLTRGCVVADGVGSAISSEIAANTVCKAADNLQNSMLIQKEITDRMAEERMEKILLNADAKLLLKQRSNCSSCTIDLVMIDERNRIHIAHRGDGMVIRISPSEKQGVILTPLDRIRESINDPIAGFMDGLGTYKNWSITELTFEKLKSTTMKLPTEKKIEVIVSYIREKTAFTMRNMSLAEAEYNEFVQTAAISLIRDVFYNATTRLSTDTLYFHSDSEPGDFIITMTDGVFDNLVYMQKAVMLHEHGMDISVSKQILEEHWNAVHERDDSKRKKRKLIIYKKICDLIGIKKWKAMRQEFKDVNILVNAIPELICKLLRRCAKEKNTYPQEVTSEEFARYLCKVTHNWLKVDDATCAVHKIPLKSQPDH